MSCTTITTNKNLTEDSFLTKADAKKRTDKISHVHYQLGFDLSEKKENYSGTTQISFDLSNANENLRIDFSKGTILSLKVNNKNQAINKHQHYLSIKKIDLVNGRNTIEISFSQSYSKDGNGFYRYIDPEDKKIYTYTNLEPYAANKVFPCFDQPDLKATYTMQVKAPNDWQVITSTSPLKKAKNELATTWSFPKSEKFSTYIWSLHAGPYAMFKDPKAKYPSRVFIRQSLKKYIKIKDWHTFTRQSFDFLDNYFGYSYPYKKYDHIIVPDHNSGAMENVAAVTFNENFISRGIKSESQRRRLANVIFHEMVHMWFENLVTMQWWNDLWLNESFATYIAALGVSKNTEFKDIGWRDFQRMKRWAYWEDQTITTHPIEADVPDTKQAFANFDGITYGKGAASLKQIHYFLGDKKFQKGLQIYFKRHAHSNTTLKDFMQALTDGSKQELTDWQEKWLQSTGVNTVETKFSCQNKKLTKLSVHQSSAYKNDPIRPHAFKLALLNKVNGHYQVTKVIPVKFTDSHLELKNLAQVDCPELIYPNYEDHDYSRVKLDSTTLNNLQENIHLVKSDFLRELYWTTLWDMVYYGEYSYKKLTKLILKNGLKYEKDATNLKNLYRFLYGRFSTASSLVNYSFNDPSLSKQEYLDLTLRLERMTWNALISARPNSESQKILFNSYLGLTKSHTALTNIKQILDGKLKLSGLPIDADKRWRIIYLLNRFNYPGAKELITAENKKDKSSQAKKMTLAATTAFPSWPIKLKLIKSAMDPKTNYSHKERSTISYNLFPLEQNKFRKRYAQHFFNDLVKVEKESGAIMAEVFTSLAPNDCSKVMDNSLQRFIDSNQVNDPSTVISLKKRNQENIRCGKVIEFSNKI